MTLWRESSLLGKIARRPSKRQQDVLDVMRLVEAHPELRAGLPHELRPRNEES